MNQGGQSVLVKSIFACLTLFIFTTAHAAPETPLAHRNTAIPAKPIIAHIKPVSLFEIDLTWSDKSQNEDGFQIERSTDNIHFQQIAQVLPDTTIYRDKNLFPATRYYYRIRAFNVAGSSSYSTGSSRTPTPAAPLSVAEWDAFYYGTVTPTNTDLVSVSAGAYHSLGLRKDGTVIAWGDNTWGESTVPANLNGVVAISAGVTHSLALKSDGTVVEWGNDPGGQTNPAANLTGVVRISAGNRHSLALKNDGTVVAWGIDDGGDLATPPDLTGVVEIAAGDGATLALKSDGTVIGWGSSYTGPATPPTNLTSVVAIAAGSGLNIAVKDDGTVAAWGGYNSFSNQTATATSNLTDVTAIALAGLQGLALEKDGSLFSWGFDGSFDPSPDLGGSAVAISANLFGPHQMALCTAPAAPSSPFATVLSPTQVRISWNDNSRDEKSFVLERTDNNITPWAPIATLGANTTNFTDATVQPGSNYTYRVRAIGKFGTSPYSDAVNVTLGPLPAPQSVFTQLGTSNEVSIWWYYSFYVDGFKLERAPDNAGSPGEWTEIASVPQGNGLQGAFNDSTAPPNHTYWYRVQAFNLLGFSDYSDPVSISVTPPPTPRYFSASTFADSISLNWSYDASPQGFKIERAPDINGAPGAWTQIALLDTNGGSQYTDKGLSLNTTYWYRVRAFNWVGDSDYAGPVSATIVPPVPPSPVYANVGATNGADITWYPVINDEDGFKLERAPDAGGAPGAWTEIAVFNDTNAYQETFHDTNALANNTYWYRVQAFNFLGISDYSTPVSIQIAPPPAPTLSPATTKADDVNLNWSINAPNLLGFEIERALDMDGAPGTWQQIATVPPGYLYYTDTNLTAGATYWYRMRAINWVGNSAYNALTVVTITPPATPNAPGAALSGITNQVNLTLDDPAGDEDGFIIERAVPTSTGFITWTQIGTTNSYGAVNGFFTDTNATPNATNLYRVRAFNSIGVSDYSAVTSVRVFPPDQPVVIQYTFSTSVDLMLFDSQFVGEATLGYYVERAPDAGGQPGTWTRIGTIGGGYYDYDYIDPGRTPGATYWYRIQAFNWVGGSPFSVALGGITIVPPAAPSGISAALSMSNHQVDISWNESPADEDGFDIQRAPDQNGNPGAWLPIGTIYATNEGNITFSDTNAVANTTNWYRIRAISASGVSDFSDAASVAIVPPSTPILEASQIGATVSLYWYDPTSTSGSVQGSRLERAADNGGSPGTWTEITNTPDFSFTDLNPGTNTWYRVRSYNWVGNSDYSEPINIIRNPPESPSHLYGTVGTTNQVNLHWEIYSQDVDGFKVERAPDVEGSPGANWVEIGATGTLQSGQISFVDTNVTANTTNWYRIRAFNAVGFSDYSGEAVVPVVPPDPPYYISAYGYRNTIQVNWSYDNSDEVGGFIVQRANDVGDAPGSWEDLVTGIGAGIAGSESITDSSVSPGVKYWYRVRALSWAGDSDYSSAASATLVPPAIPGTPSLRPGTTNQIILSWSGNADEDGFHIERAPDAGGVPGDWAPLATIATTNFYTTFTDTNVTANTTNWYRIQAFNAIGTSDYSGANSIAVMQPATAPELFGGVASMHEIDLQWQTDPGFIQGYKIERALDVAGSPGTWSVIADVPTANTLERFSDTTVVLNKKYWYRVQTYNWAGVSPYSNALLINDAPPDAPTLSATSIDPDQIKLSWTSPDGYLTGFELERAADVGGVPGPWIQIAALTVYQNYISAFNTNYSDMGIPAGQPFWYRVRASDAGGNSPYSNEVKASVPQVTIAPPPQILSLIPTNGSMLIGWATTGGNTDMVQAATSLTGIFSNISPPLPIGGTGAATTNYLDAGALTNAPARFYRIQSSH